MQESGLVGASINPERISAAFIAGIQGGVTVLRSTGSTAHLEATLDILMDYLRHLRRLRRHPDKEGPLWAAGG
jgi:hypothetical protein